MIKLSIGDDAVTLQVPQSILCKTSKFFKNAMKREWAEQRTDPHTIDLPDDCIENVTSYILWLESHEICAKKAIGGSFDPTDPDDQQELGKVLIKAYIYNLKVIDDIYRKTIIRHLFRLHDTYDWIPRPDALEMLYEATSIGDSGRRLMQNIMAHKANDDAYETIVW